MATKEQDEKSKRLRELLSSFYGSGSPESDARLGRRDTLQGINLPNFDADHYISSLVSCFLFPFAISYLLCFGMYVFKKENLPSVFNEMLKGSRGELQWRGCSV